MNKVFFILYMILFNFIDSSYFVGFKDHKAIWTSERKAALKYNNVDKIISDKSTLESLGFGVIMVME